MPFKFFDIAFDYYPLQRYARKLESEIQSLKADNTATKMVIESEKRILDKYRSTFGILPDEY